VVEPSVAIGPRAMCVVSVSVGCVTVCEFFAGRRVTAVGPTDLVVSAGACVGVFCIRFVRGMLRVLRVRDVFGEAVRPLGGVCVAGYPASRWGEFCVCVCYWWSPCLLRGVGVIR